MAGEKRRREDEAAWGEERAFIEARIAAGPLNGGRVWMRDALHEEHVGRHGSDAD